MDSPEDVKRKIKKVRLIFDENVYHHSVCSLSNLNIHCTEESVLISMYTNILFGMVDVPYTILGVSTVAICVCACAVECHMYAGPLSDFSAGFL